MSTTSAAGSTRWVVLSTLTFRDMILVPLVHLAGCR
jgi:hypothetical protein